MERESIKLLVIEDNPDDLYFLKSLLERPLDGPHYRIDSAHRLETGLAMLAREEYDVLLLDLVLPDSLTIDTFLRAHTRKPEIPIVVLTGLSDRAMALHAMKQGAQDFLVKGEFSARDLERALSYALERKRLSARLETIVRSSMDGIMVLDDSGIVRYMNPSAESILSRPAVDLVGRAFEHRLLPGEATEIRMLQPQGGVKVVEVRGTPIDWDARPALLASLRDITDLLLIEKLKGEISQRRNLDRLKDQFVEFISRRVKAPLTVVKAAFEALKSEAAEEPSEQPDLVRLAEQNLARLARLSDNLLALAELESGRTAVRRRRVNLASLLRTAVESARFLHKDQRLDWEVILPDDLPPIQADPSLVETALGHLLDNALRFARRRIMVGAKLREAAPAQGSGTAATRPGIEIVVADDGPGIPPDRRAELFTKYAAADAPSRGSESDGAGLGLAICKEILRRHDGAIWVESDSGQGSSFHLVLPRDAEGA